MPLLDLTSLSRTRIAPQELIPTGETSADFTNVLVGADRDGNGLDREELRNVIDRLRRLAADGHGAATVENGIVAALEAALANDRADIPVRFVVEDGKLTVAVADDDDDPT